MDFGEGRSRVRGRRAARNLAVLRRVALDPLRADATPKASLKGKEQGRRRGQRLHGQAAERVNGLMRWPWGALGVRRVIVGSSLGRVAYTGILRAAREMADTGTCGFTEGLTPCDELNDLFRRPRTASS